MAATGVRARRRNSLHGVRAGRGSVIRELVQDAVVRSRA